MEMGLGELYLGGMTRDQALAFARAARPSDPTGANQSARPHAPATSDRRDPSGAERSARPRAPAVADRRAPAAPDGPAVALPVLPDSYDEVRGLALGCTRCRLADGRKNVVFSDGPVDARLIVVGEAPGANEDETGLPFVGAAGKFLDLLLATVDLSREDSVYICNVLKCRPPGNRNPLPDEIDTCSPYLHKQIELVRPQALLAVGSFSAKLLTGQPDAALGKLRGKVHSYRGVPLVVTYHPAALLRNANWTRAFWDDLQLLRGVMDAT
jgi:DNA polymerase